MQEPTVSSEPLIPSPTVTKKRAADQIDVNATKKIKIRVPNFKDLYFQNNADFTVEKTNDAVRLVGGAGGIHEVLTPPFKAPVADIGPGGNKNKGLAWVDPNDSSTWKFTIMGVEGGIDNEHIVGAQTAFKDYMETLQRKVTDAMYEHHPKLRAKVDKKAAADPANDTEEKRVAAAKTLFYKLAGKAFKYNTDSASPYHGNWQITANTRVCYDNVEKKPQYFDNKYQPTDVTIGRGPIIQVVLSFAPYVMGNKYGISCRFRESAIVVHRCGGDGDLTDDVLDNLEHPYSFSFKKGGSGKPDAIYVRDCTHRTPQMAVKYAPSSTLGKFADTTEKNAKITMACVETPEMKTFTTKLRDDLVKFAMSNEDIMAKQKKEIVDVYGADSLEKELAEACCMPNNNGITRFSMRQFRGSQEDGWTEKHLVTADADGERLDDDILDGATVRVTFHPSVYVNANGEFGITYRIHETLGVIQMESGGGNDEDNATVSFEL